MPHKGVTQLINGCCGVSNPKCGEQEIARVLDLLLIPKTLRAIVPTLKPRNINSMCKRTNAVSSETLSTTSRLHSSHPFVKVTCAPLSLCASKEYDLASAVRPPLSTVRQRSFVNSSLRGVAAPPSVAALPSVITVSLGAGALGPRRYRTLLCGNSIRKMKVHETSAVFWEYIWATMLGTVTFRRLSPDDGYKAGEYCRKCLQIYTFHSDISCLS